MSAPTRVDAAVERTARPPAVVSSRGPQPPRDEPAGAPPRVWLPFVGVAALAVLAVLALQLASRLRSLLEAELADRMRVAASTASDLLVRDDHAPGLPLEPRLLVRLDEIRRSTRVSDIVLYDVDGERLGTPRASSVPRRLRVPARMEDAAPADPRLREPERDGAGGLTLVIPTGGAAGVGAILTRIDREGLKGLATVDFLFQIAKVLGGVLLAAGGLILLRWSGRGTASEPTAAPLRTDVDVVLGTMKEVVTTLKDSEIEYRDRMTAAEADAERTRATNDLILGSITSGIVAFDLRGRITMFNRGAEQILGVGSRFAQGRSVREVFGVADDLARLAADIVERQRAVSRIEIKRPGVDGDPAWIGISSSVIRQADGAAAGGIFLIADLTETRRLREQAGLQDRLTAVGEMSAGIAHEIKNALHSLMGFANLLRDDYHEETPLPVQGILSEVDSLETLVKGVLEFSKPADLLRAPVSLNELVRDVTKSLRGPAERAGVRVEADLASDLPDVLVDADGIRRAFLNLGLNAVEAMPDGGALTISTRLAESPGDDGSGTAGAQVVRAAFRDSGPGIAESDRARIFTPFHTTKRNGSGLGLALVHRTVTDHGGRIQLHSRVGVGTEFVLHLPVEGR